jgi:hypothetical protein
MGRKRSQALKDITTRKAAKGFASLLEGHLVRATELDTLDESYGIVVSYSTIFEELQKVSPTMPEEWKDSIWAMWTKKSKEEAVKLYESIDNREFVPKLYSGGQLTCLSPRGFDFEIID